MKRSSVVLATLALALLASPVVAQEAPKADAPVYVSSGVALGNFNPSLRVGQVTIRPNGELVYDEDYTPDVAARQFWEAVVALGWRGTAPPANRQDVTVTVAFSPDLFAAALKRLGITKDDPTTRTEQRLVKDATEEAPAVYEDVVIPLPTPLERVQAWLLQTARNSLEPELLSLKVEAATAIVSDDETLKKLDSESCALINDALKARKLEPLKRCGGGGPQ